MKREYESRIVKELADALKKNNIPFEEQTVLNGLRTDFWFRAPDGDAIIAEVKEWEPTFANIKYASNLVKRYQNVTKVDHGYFVIPGLKRSSPSHGVISDREFMQIIGKTFQGKKSTKKEKAPIPEKIKQFVFAIVPLAKKYTDVYFNAMIPAAKYVKASCYRIDKQDYTGDIMERIKYNINNSIAVIADLSESKPNVFYEVGLAHALKANRTIHICSTPLGKLPFDVSHWNTIEYKQGQVYELNPRLKKRLKAVLEDSPK